MHQGSVLSVVFFAVVVSFVTEMAREGVLSWFLYAVDLLQVRQLIDSGMS